MTATKFSPDRATLDVRLHSSGRRPIAVARGDFKLSAAGDIFGVRRWNAAHARTQVPPGRSRVFRLTFRVPSAALERGALFYSPVDGSSSGRLALGRSAAIAGPRASAAAAGDQVIHKFPITNGFGDPWGTAVDRSGNVWFAEPGCDFTPTCPAGTRPGHIGKLDPSSGALTYYTLPDIPGNQPIFLAFDDSGNLWFTTPNNSMIGEFSPSTGTFAGQWPVTAGSGPWDLTVVNGQIWYAEHLVSAVGSFDPTTHSHQDFPTPSGNSHPYGITASGGRIWFTENDSSVDQIAMLDTGSGNAISEYPIVRPVSGTPHLIVVDGSGRPWWTEGWSNTIATLDPATATPGSCGSSSGTCAGVQRFQLPSSTRCGAATHTSGIALDTAADRIWLDNSLTAQVGSFTPSTQTFAMTTLSDCNAHPHDGLTVDSAGYLWLSEQFGNAIDELIPAGAPGPAVPPQVSITPDPPVSGSPTTFRASWANSAGIAEVEWTFGDGMSATGDPVTHIYATAGAKTVTALVKDGNGNQTQVTKVVSVTPGPADTTGSSRPSAKGAPLAREQADALTAARSARRVKADLSKLLGAITSRRTIRALRAKGRYAISFAAPGAGSVMVFWQPTGERKRVRLATARTRYRGAGTAKVTIELTSRGRQFLRHHRSARLAAKVIFLPAGDSGVASRKRFALSP